MAGLTNEVFGFPLMALGTLGLVTCITTFAIAGGGTLAPVDPPTRLVATAIYRHTRNPMYVSVLLLLAGEAILFGSVGIALWTAAVALAFNAFVIGYEEPALRRKFGTDYDSYPKRTPRWLGNLRG